MSLKFRFQIVLSCTAAGVNPGHPVSVTSHRGCSPNSCGSVVPQKGVPPAGKRGHAAVVLPRHRRQPESGRELVGLERHCLEEGRWRSRP
jgi:hypothetical protein